MGAVVARGMGITSLMVLGLAAVMMAGCSTAGVPDIETSALQEDPRRPSEIEKARAQFKAEHYGKAAEAFRVAVEAEPKNPEAWLGLAASYDQVGRFDLADEAYERLAELIGDTPEILNNRGYSYLLRGDFERSRKLLITAYAKDPDNVLIRNNIELLNMKLASVGRAPVLVN